MFRLPTRILLIVIVCFAGLQAYARDSDKTFLFSPQDLTSDPAFRLGMEKSC